MDFENTPSDLRVNLTIYGIDEVEHGICQDTYENRNILRAEKFRWQTVFDDNGEVSGNILAISPAMSADLADRRIASRNAILVDPRDDNSDYLTGARLLSEEKSDQLCPPWVLRYTRAWMSEKDRSLKGLQSRRRPVASPEMKVVGPPIRCIRIKSNGRRCLYWTMNRKGDDGLCKVHLIDGRHDGGLSVQQARKKLKQAAAPAVDVLEYLMDNAESESVRLKASTEILDRSGVRGGVEIDSNIYVEVRPAAEILTERLQILRDRAGVSQALTTGKDDNTVDAEIVEDGEPVKTPITLRSADKTVKSGLTSKINENKWEVGDSKPSPKPNIDDYDD